MSRRIRAFLKGLFLLSMVEAQSEDDVAVTVAVTVASQKCQGDADEQTRRVINWRIRATKGTRRLRESLTLKRSIPVGDGV